MYVNPRKTELCEEKAWRRCSGVAGNRRRIPKTSQFTVQAAPNPIVDTITRVSYEPSPSLTHSPAKSSRGLRPDRSRIEKKERAGSGIGTPTVEGTVWRI